MILTLKELAEYLRVNERTILRMIQNGKIQGAKIGGQWRFNGSQIDQVFFPAEGEEAALEEDDGIKQSIIVHPQIGIPVSRVMHEDRILLNLKSTDAEGVIKELTDARLLYGLVLDATELRNKCMQREAVLSTAVGEGIAIPHPRDPIPTLRASAAVIYGYSKAGVDFGAPDGKPVHMFFLACSQNIELHLHLMGCLARLLKDKSFVDALADCKTNAEVIKLVMEHERTAFLAQEEENK
ncbi:MAG: PTS sugar transporter subunit IIA [Lentisphaeria bacterium]|nr:PTS sugar transporter subunit IIA [Lentisphaeria bacterium]